MNKESTDGEIKNTPEEKKIKKIIKWRIKVNIVLMKEQSQMNSLAFLHKETG